MSENPSEGTVETKISLHHLLSEKDGGWDWNTLGNILTGYNIGEVLKASYFDFKYGRMQRDFRADTDWKFAYEEKNIVVLKKHLKKSPIMCFMGRGVIELPLNEIATFISQEESVHVWDKFLVNVRCVERLKETETMRDGIAYFCYESSQCLVKARRDFVVYLRGTYIGDKYVMTAISVDHPDCPTVHGTVRAECYAGSGWVLEPYKGSTSETLVSYIVNIDLKGPLPPIIVNRVLKRQPLAIHYLRQHLMKMRRSGDEDGGHSVSLSAERSFERNRHSMSTTYPSLRYRRPATAIAFSERHFEDPLPVGSFMGTQQQETNLGYRRVPSKESTPAAPLPSEVKDGTMEQRARGVSCNTFEGGSPLGPDSVGKDKVHTNPLSKVTGDEPNLKLPVEDESSDCDSALADDSMQLEQKSVDDCSYYTCAEFDTSASS